MACLYVKIHYGPYKTTHIMSQNTDKIEGLKGELLKLGFRVKLIQEEYLNYCMLEMCGHQIFRCNVNDFQSGSEDPLCQKAVRAVLDASARFLRADTYFWLWSLIDHQIFHRNEYSPKPVWPVTVDFAGKDDTECPCHCDTL